MARQAISKKLRFEVFKRDSFTCQYCGRTAPNVILEIDHINPVSKGGKNNILNLVTSCMDCNRGKSNRELKENTVLDATLKQAKVLSERNEQLKLMAKWQDELLDEAETQAHMLNKYIGEYSGWNYKDPTPLKQLIVRHGFNLTHEAIKKSFEWYFKGTLQSHEIAIKRIERTLKLLKERENDQFAMGKAMIAGRLRANCRSVDSQELSKYLSRIKTPDDVKEINSYSLGCHNIHDFYDMCCEYFEVK